MSIDKISGKLVKHKHKGADISDITNYIGQPLGVFITSYPSTPSVGRYDFAGTDGAVISGETYNNGDSAFWDGSAWTRIPAQVMDDELNKLVSKTGDQTINGVKTFSSSPVIPSATNNTEAQNKAGVESQITARQETIRSQSTTKSPTSKLMDDLLKANPTFKGAAIPSTNPGIPDGSVFYIASTQGTYANFGGFVLDGGFAVLSNVSGSWTGTKFLKTEMDAKAAHGYTSNPKTLKEVDDNLAQLAGDVSDEIKYIDLEAVGNSGLSIVGYIGPTGGIMNTVGWYRTDYLAINKYHDIKAIGDSANQNLSFIAFFDVNHSFISSIKNVGVSGVEYTLPKANIPINAEYAILSTTTALRGASYLKQTGISLKEKIETIEIDVVKSEENISLAISELIKEQVVPVMNTALLTTGFAGIMVANTFGITGVIIGINAALYGSASDVDVYLINNTTKETTLITTILAASQTVNVYKNYLFPSHVTVEVGYSIALGGSRCRYGSISGLGGSMYNVSGSWVTNADTVFSYQLIKEAHFIPELQNDVLKNTNDITAINSELSDITKSLFWNIPSKLYGSSTSVWGFYRDVLIYNPVLTNNSPYRMAYSDGLSINQFGYDVIRGISADTTKTFQLIQVNNGNTYETPAIVSSKAVDIVIKTKVSTPQNVLVISDSFIDSGYDILTNITSLATADGITINWVGTHINTDGQNCEGRAGWSEETFFGGSSPFMNGGNFDFSNYLTVNGISVDKIVILLGSNMPVTNPTVNVGTWIQKMINGGTGVTSSIRSALPNVPILVCLCMPYPEDCPNLSTISYGGNRKWYQDYRMLANKKYLEYFDGTINKTYVVPMINFHPNLGYTGTEIDNGQFNLDTFPKIRVVNDIHPSATGAMCIAYNIYNMLSLDGL